MTATPLNPAKAKKLRPLRAALAILAVVLFILILDRLPTSKTVTKTTKISQEESSEGNYYYLTGFAEKIETDLEKRLRDLGVPEDEYENVGDYLGKDEIYEFEQKANLALELESVWVSAEENDLTNLRTIFSLDTDFDFGNFSRTSSAPSEYKNLAELISNYYRALTNIEDYDVLEYKIFTK